MLVLLSTLEVLKRAAKLAADVAAGGVVGLLTDLMGEQALTPGRQLGEAQRSGTHARARQCQPCDSLSLDAISTGRLHLGGAAKQFSNAFSNCPMPPTRRLLLTSDGLSTRALRDEFRRLLGEQPESKTVWYIPTAPLRDGMGMGMVRSQVAMLKRRPRKCRIPVPKERP
ncbi:hypothetical protein AK812_SmicGene9017 [Symbiodinium microadriaticum]|uniref:Uncharacterized protein n=1 Tax=Symbiodinium microadriaticum TaxID=2951 RepID=A0A1Q9EJC0_SYMMI|nr:hypothetical protein AK812_SmicGene9017 [Symbiodinium microadriaticum]